jgi:3-isopropylmalate/(R)-2-methylmalate dehydratase large subunit
MNVIEKILARASGRATVQPGDLVMVEVTTAVMHDLMFTKALWREPLKLRDPDRLVIIFDHVVPSNSTEIAEAHQRARDFVRRFGIRRFHDIGIDGGICHQVTADKGYALPGTVLTCSDSHASSGGAFNCAARGTAQLDTIAAIATGQNWFQVGETIRYEFAGRLKPNAAAKDVFLHMAGHYGDHAMQNIEFADPGAALNMNARRTICTMATELSAEFAVFEFDDQLDRFMRERTSVPFEPAFRDKDAHYRDIRTIDLSSIEPLVAKPDAVVNNSVAVGELKDIRIDQAFVGSCANGTLDDLEAAARVVSGRKVAAGVRFIVTPASQGIYLEATRRGYIATLVEAGAIVTNSTCGACAGINFGIIGPGEVCITSSTRNFKGRMGSKEAKIYMASSATVAASAVRGCISDPSEFFN